MHYGIIIIRPKRLVNKSIFWKVDENWNLVYTCRAYEKNNYSKYVSRLIRNHGIKTTDFNLTSEITDIQEAINEAKFNYNVNMSLKGNGHPDFTNEEFDKILDKRIKEIKKKYN